MNILNWIDDKGYEEGSLNNEEFIKSQESWRIFFQKHIHQQHVHTGSPVYDKLSDGCCHKTVQERCADCSFKEENNGSV